MSPRHNLQLGIPTSVLLCGSDTQFLRVSFLAFGARTHRLVEDDVTLGTHTAGAVTHVHTATEDAPQAGEAVTHTGREKEGSIVYDKIAMTVLKVILLLSIHLVISILYL